MNGASKNRLFDEIAQVARQRGAGSAYVDRVRRATARLAARETAEDDVRSALLAVEDHLTIDIDVPTASRYKIGALLKYAIKRFTIWYVRYVGNQVTTLGQAIARLGAALVQRTESLEQTTGDLEKKVQSLEVRVEHLERGTDGR
jgi:hypothetical protein